MTGPDQNAETMLRVVIARGGTAGWMAANLMAHHWQGAPVSITVVESPDIGIIGVGEGSTPQLKAFFDRLGIAETDWMPACDATYKNGISFHGWSERPGCEHYFHPFPSAIDLHTNPAFSFHSHFRRQGFDLAAHPDRFFLTARLARDRLAPLPDHRFPFDLSYGYHFDAYKVGAFLRKTSLDELPQFWHVLKGDMSLVGTRPPTADEVSRYSAHHWRRLDVKPGLTGQWQVSGRSAIKDFEEIVNLDLHYQAVWSPWYDFQVIARTIWVLLSRHGAY